MSVSLEEDYQVTLPYDKPKQQAILGYLILDPKFFALAHSKIKPEWFIDPFVRQVYTGMQRFALDHGRPPTPDELMNLEEFVLEEQAKKNRIYEAINLSKLATQSFGLDALRVELTTWLKSQIFEVEFRKAYKEYTQKQPKEAFATMGYMVETLRTATFNEEREETFSNPSSDLEHARTEEDRACTFGLTLFDRLLLPDAKGGSLLPGDMSIVLAPSNVGKTTSVITTIVANIRKGKKVLFITHEGRPEDIKQKIRQCFMNMSYAEIMALYSTSKGLMQLRQVGRFIDEHLTYIPYNKAGLTIEDVMSLVRNKNEQMKAKNSGKGYDLLVDDYPAKLTTEQAKGGNMSKRNIDDIVYNYFVQIALELQLHAICPIQTNREGSKVNKGITTERLLVSEDVLESWGPITAATNVWTANRSLRDKVSNRVIYFIDKSRSSETGYAVVCRTNFAHSITHSDELNATFYRGSGTHAEKLDQYLNQYLGNEFPEHLRA